MKFSKMALAKKKSPIPLILKYFTRIKAILGRRCDQNNFSTDTAVENFILFDLIPISFFFILTIKRAREKSVSIRPSSETQEKN